MAARSLKLMALSIKHTRSYFRLESQKAAQLDLPSRNVCVCLSSSSFHFPLSKKKEEEEKTQHTTIFYC